MKCPLCQQENRSPVNFCSRCGASLGVAVVGGPSYAQVRAENEALTRSLGAAVEQQTATAEILRVISSSPTDVQPVFDAIVRSAVRLCDGLYGFVGRFDGEQIHIAAHHNYTPDALRVMREMYPMRPSRLQMSGRVILSRSVIQIEDLLEDPDYAQHLALAGGWRASLGVPLLREGNAIGMIAVMRGRPGRFSETQVELLKTFANQAVIAIENVRLFNETKQALEQQTATSEILRVISQSPTDVQPVFEAIGSSAWRLLGGFGGAVYRVVDEKLHLAAYISTNPTGDAALRDRYPRPLEVFSPPGEAIRRCAPVVLTDTDTDGWVPDDVRDIVRKRGIRSGVWVPMMREGVALGAIGVTRSEPGSFRAEQITLLKTFADQAVIAIENVRLFKELEARNAQLTELLGQQTATGEILSVIARSPTDIQPVFDTVVESAARLCEANDVAIYRSDGDRLRFVAHHGSIPPPGPVGEYFRTMERGSATSRSVLEGRILHIADLQAESDEFPTGSDIARRLGFRALLSVPLLRRGAAIGTIMVRRTEARLFSERQVALLQTFADQAVIAIENVRLFSELEAANRELAAASQHKSEFLANMSHELRTPLNAIIGFSEVLSERMFGELNEKQEEYSKDIHASGQHLLSLINDILDLSKVEAGRMELEVTDFHLPTALDSALTLVRERTARRGIALQMSVDDRLGQMRADERKVRQVVLNLLSNAIKFTAEGGRIEVGAISKDGFVEVSVSDTGVGIASDDQEAVFEEFRQVGTADKKVEGTGLGLTLCRKFVELHGGKIWVKSQVGVGSTFTFTIPVRHGE